MRKLSMAALIIGALSLSTSVYAQESNTASSGNASAASQDAGAQNGNGNNNDSGKDSSSSSAAAATTGADTSAAPANTSGTGDKACTTGAIDAAGLSAVTSITVFSTDDCSGNAAVMDAGAQTALAGDAQVAKAIADAGYQGQQIIGYSLDGTSLSVYVKK